MPLSWKGRSKGREEVKKEKMKAPGAVRAVARRGQAGDQSPYFSPQPGSRFCTGVTRDYIGLETRACGGSMWVVVVVDATCPCFGGQAQYFRGRPKCTSSESSSFQLSSVTANLRCLRERACWEVRSAR